VTILMVCSNLIVTLYVYVMERCWIKTWFRENHSKTHLRKVYRMSIKWEKITGFYLLRAPKRTSRTDRVVLSVINMNLISIPLVLFVAYLYSADYVSEDFRNWTVALVNARDILSLALLMAVVRMDLFSSRGK